jgi:TorA maturation chaperone TorD
MEPRVALYEAAAALFSYSPSRETLTSINRQLSGYKERMEFWDDSLLVSAAEGLSKALMKEEPEGDLRIDYKNLFMNTGPNAMWPSESAFLDPKLCGVNTSRLSAAYALYGFQKASWFSGPDDHVAIECLFMSLMGRNFVTMAQEMILNPSVYVDHLERQYDFLVNHLLQWIPLWERRVRDRGTTCLYRAAAHLTRVLVETDRKKLVDYVKLIQGCGYNNYHRNRLTGMDRQKLFPMAGVLS